MREADEVMPLMDDPLPCVRDGKDFAALERSAVQLWNGWRGNGVKTYQLQQMNDRVGEFCKGCPMADACLKNSVEDRITAVAGGRVLLDGEIKVVPHRKRPSRRSKDAPVVEKMRRRPMVGDQLTLQIA